MLDALFGTLLVASGTGTLNQYLEHRFDAQMRRTCRRPIAAGRLSPRVAAWFGISLSMVGSVFLFATVQPGKRTGRPGYGSTGRDPADRPGVPLLWQTAAHRRVTAAGGR
jgi:hypothetical protein